MTTRTTRTTRARRAPAALLLLAALAGGLAGCASADEEGTSGAAPAASASPSASPPASPPASPSAAVPAPGTTAPEAPDATAAREIEVAIADGEVSPATGTYDIAEGDRVRITVTSDEQDELHVHGFGGPSLDLEPGVPGTLELTADETGQFEVETHGAGLLLFTLAVR
ncbi:hypothetical protein [Vallicoccus soli]|uniref:EfeO-type cupredoxin-like domain-containing protein n=1 Tax=Vallicoccus soli TaxID=2339232 RepID=A0A3A3Z3T1_9ACTN|nr:hypothetical protein [Vallicoccus soli]RJK97613.1 hypothetical protein D5H78_00850 [Vallicoccus soli]